MNKICLIFLSLLCGCQWGSPEQPSIPEEKMVQVMADLATAEAAVNHLSGPLKDSLQKVYTAQVLEMHHLSLENYEKNLQLYARDIPTLERIVKEAESSFDMDKKASPIEEKK
jgi:hypothetical protein